MQPNIFDKGLQDHSLFYNPYPVYSHLREQSPVLWSAVLDAWIVTRYKDIEVSLKSEYVSAKRQGVQATSLPPELREPLERFYGSWLMYKDPPDHTRIKRCAQALFSQPKLDRIFEKVSNYAKSLVLENGQHNTIEVVNNFSRPVSILSVCDLFDIRPEDYHSLHTWARDIVDFMQGRFTEDQRLHAAKRAQSAILGLDAFIQKLETHEVSGSPCHSDEMNNVIANILADGHEPLASAITNGILALAENPDQQSQLPDSAEIKPSGVNEILRYDPPFQYLVRRSVSDIKIGGVSIPAGHRILFMIASANRDSEIFHSPDTFDLSRQASSLHKSFGFDRHFCLGAPLANTVIKLALQAFLQRFPRFRLEYPSTDRHLNLGSRALKSLHIVSEA